MASGEQNARSPAVHDRLTRRVIDVCDSAGAFIEYWGFKAIHGRVWTLMALSHRPLSQTAIAEALGVSRSLISGAISELAEWGLVRQTADRRNAPWEAVIDVWPTISDVLRSREWMLVEQARLALEAAIEEAEIMSSGGRSIDWDLGRMRLLLTMTELAQTLLKLLIAIRVPRSVEGFGNWMGRAVSVVRSLRAVGT